MRREQAWAAAVAEHIAAAEERMSGAARIAAPNTEAAVVEEAVAHTAAGPVEAAARQAQPRVPHTRPEAAVARERRALSGIGEALRLLRPPPARRRKGNLSLREERLVRIAGISS
jgi:hypothetical protein